MTDSTTHPVPRHVVEKYGDSWIQPDHIVTNGPFKLQVWHPVGPLILERNPAYHSQFEGNVQRIDISVFLDWSPVSELYETDQLDIMISMEALSLAEQGCLRQHHPEEYTCQPSFTTRNIAFNVRQPPFDDIRVRCALAMAVNKATLSVIISGHVVPATGGFVPPNMPGHSAGIGLAYDPEQARQLLAEAGYPNGEGFPAVTWLTGWSMSSTCQDLQQQWHDILGVDLKWDGVAWTEYHTTLGRVQPHIFMDGWASDYPDPDNFLRVGIPRQCGWHNDVYTELVEKARRLMDHEERMNLYAQADRLLMEEAVIIPLYHRQLRLLVKPWLKNVHFTPSEHPLWKDVVIEPH